ncbi:hypothetical protein DAI22_11g080600 [Oryza sativa Japonica Group]|nr:hypothetical protein DAI22_11g080600 [Oryza sativa Japonica Group]
MLMERGPGYRKMEGGAAKFFTFRKSLFKLFVISCMNWRGYRTSWKQCMELIAPSTLHDQDQGEI